MSTLSDQSLQACNTTNQALSNNEIQQYLSGLDDWKLQTENNIQQICKHFSFKNYTQAITFTNQIATLAEQQNHHPKICIEWGKVSIGWWTHTVNGLFINDFIMAAKCDDIFIAPKNSTQNVDNDNTKN